MVTDISLRRIRVNVNFIDSSYVYILRDHRHETMNVSKFLEIINI
jgi:hypothetical protein